MKTKTVLSSILLTILIARTSAQICETGSLAPNPDNCNSFLQCLYGKFVVMPCPEGLHWNKLAQICDYPANAKCQEEHVETTEIPAVEPSTKESVDPEHPAGPEAEEPIQPSEEPATVEEGPEAGDSCEIGSYAPNPVNCNSFLQCVHGNFKEMPCPTGLHWNKLAQTCDYPANAHCQETPVKPTEIPTEEPVEPTDGPETTEGPDKPTEDPETEGPIDPTEQPTEEPTTEEPIEPSEEPSTEGSGEQPTEEPTDEPVEPTEEPSTEAPLPVCECGETFPDPTDCSSFFKCVEQQWTHETCTDGLHFNQGTQLCDWPEQAQCPFNCECGDEISAYKSCDTYYKCVDHRFVLHHCSPGLHWNSLTMECDWPQSAQCVWDNNSGEKTTEAQTDSPTTEAVKTTEAQTEPTSEPSITAAPTTAAPTTVAPTTAAHTTEAPTTEAQTTEAPTTEAPTTEAPTTEDPTTAAPTTAAPTTVAPTTEAPTTEAPTTAAPTTVAPTTAAPTTEAPTTSAPTTAAPTTEAPTTAAPTTEAPTTAAPTTQAPTTTAPTTTVPITTTTTTEATTTEDYDYGDYGEDYTPPDWWGRKIEIHPRFKYIER